MSKPTTPVHSPKLPAVAKMETPSTPPPPVTTRSKLKRLSATYLTTPDHHLSDVVLPFSPSRKRASQYTSNKSPDYKLNSHNVMSPYNAMSLLKTPRHLAYDDNNEASSKSQKTPQYFSPGKRLFAETDTAASREELSEISLQLKSKLSSALGKLQLKKSAVSSSKVLSDLTLLQLPLQLLQLPPYQAPTFSQRANFNLQTLQQSPISVAMSPPPTQPLYDSPSALSQSPHLERTVLIPSLNEETSAHNALIAALSRQQQRRSRSSFSSPKKPRRNSAISQVPPTSSLAAAVTTSKALSATIMAEKLPSINTNDDDNDDNDFKTEKNGGDTEQDAVLSLMSLSSPQAKFTHSRSQSLNNNASPVSSRASVVTSPVGLPVQLPPISGLISSSSNNFNKMAGGENDEDATDIEDATDDDVDEDEQ